MTARPRVLVSLVALTLLSASLLLRAQLTEDDPGLNAVANLVVMIDSDKGPGAGIVFAVAEGYIWIATVHHVVRTPPAQDGGEDKLARNIRVRLRQRRLTEYPAEHFSNSTSDIAVIKVRDPGLAFDFAQLGNPDDAKGGDRIYAVGHAQGDNWHVTYLPGALRSRRATLLHVQSAYIENGHSGGALLDDARRIIGLVNTRVEAIRVDHAVRVLAGDLDLPVQLKVRGTLPNPGPAKSQTRTDQGGLKYLWIPPGTFRMGCSEKPKDEDCDKTDEFRAHDEFPAHDVTLKGFWMGETEVTIGAYEKYRASNTNVLALPEKDADGRKLNTAAGNPQLPAVAVTWQEAVDYCNWANAGLRLPTEAEWEYAARAGTTGKHYASPLGTIAWFGDNSGEPIDSAKLWADLGRYRAKYDPRLFTNGNGPHPVADPTKRPNAWGLRDMLGNVWEWNMDWYDQDYYKTAPIESPKGPDAGTSRVLRGGSWYDFPTFVRVSLRFRGVPTYRYSYFGFRCAGEVR